MTRKIVNNLPPYKLVLVNKILSPKVSHPYSTDQPASQSVGLIYGVG